MSAISTLPDELTATAEPRVHARAAERIGRLRRNPAARRMLAETLLRAEHLVYPLFVRDGRDVVQPIASLPGQSQWMVDSSLDRRA